MVYKLLGGNDLKIKNIYILLYVTLIIMIVVYLLDLEIMKIIDVSEQPLIVENEKSYDTNLIRVQYVTNGTTWKFIGNNKGSVFGDMVLVSLIDPRCLKQNEYFNIDFHFEFLACTPKILNGLVNSRFKIVVPFKLYAIDKENIEEQSSYTIRDMSLIGLMKIFFRLLCVEILILYIYTRLVKCLKYKK